MVNVICPNCFTDFEVPVYKTKEYKRNFCSRKCHDECRRKEKYEKLSELVGSDFRMWLYHKYVVDLKGTRDIAEELYGNRKSFSSINGWLTRFDIPLRKGSEAVKVQWIGNGERRDRQSETAKEVLLKEEVRERIKETQRTEESRKKSRDSKIGIKNPMYGVTGSEHPKWNPKRTHEQRVSERKTNAVREWRVAVFKRDNFTCQQCGDSQGGNLVAHHIDSYDWCEEKRADTDNGITLCEKCHKDFHKEYGYGSNTRKQFEEFGSKPLKVGNQ